MKYLLILGLYACDPVAQQQTDATERQLAHQLKLQQCYQEAVNGTGTQKQYFDCACKVDKEDGLAPLPECQ